MHPIGLHFYPRPHVTLLFYLLTREVDCFTALPCGRLVPIDSKISSLFSINLYIVHNATYERTDRRTDERTDRSITLCLRLSVCPSGSIRIL